jgi:serine/threonine protein phosphatase 1
MSKYVMGDVHGGYRGLVQALDRVKFNFEEDTLIALGDVTDGWSEVAECIELLLTIKNLIYIKGNHDEWTERFLGLTLKTGPADYNYNWYRQGGKATYNSYFTKPELVEKHLKFLREAELHYIDDENRLYLHAGLNPDVDLDKQKHIDVGQAEGNAVFYWDRLLWKHIVHAHKHGEDIVWDRYKEIYIGHSPTNRNLEFKHGMPVNIGNIWNMDTGAAYDGKVSIMDIDTKEIRQSDLIYELYPEEMGRNGEFLTKK